MKTSKTEVVEIAGNQQIGRQETQEELNLFGLASADKHQEARRKGKWNTFSMSRQVLKLKNVHEYRYIEIRKKFLLGNKFLGQ